MNGPNSIEFDWRQELSRHRRWLTTVLVARGVEPAYIDDVLQEVSVAALAGAERLRDRTKVASWLYRIAVTSALQHRRRLGRRRRHWQSYAETRTVGTERDALDWLLVKEQRQLVRQVLEHLPPREAELLLLKYTEDWSYRQLADHLGTSISAVEARLHRAREKLRSALARLNPHRLTQIEE